MKKWLIIHIPIFILISITAISIYLLNQESTNKRIILKYEISDGINKYTNNEISIIDISDATTFAWDKLYIFGPYSSPKTINSKLDYFWMGSYFTNIDSSDRITLLVFMKGRHVIQYLEYPRDLGDFSTAINEYGYSNKNATFIMNDKGKIIWLGEN